MTTPATPDDVDSLESFAALRASMEETAGSIATARCIGAVCMLARAMRDHPQLGSVALVAFDPENGAVEIQGALGFGQGADPILATRSMVCNPALMAQAEPFRSMGGPELAKACEAVFEAAELLSWNADLTPFASGLGRRLPRRSNSGARVAIAFAGEPSEVARQLLMPELAAEIERRSLSAAASPAAQPSRPRPPSL